MKTIKELDNEIKDLQNRLESVEGSPTEVYTRIVGYYRSLKNWNKGKREEFRHRTLFTPETRNTDAASNAGSGAASTAAAQAVDQTITRNEPVRHMYFYRMSCPNCPAVKELLDELEMPGSAVNVDTETGMASALAFNIYATPTVIFFNEDENEVFRTTSTADIRVRFPVLANVPQTA
ncbi:MAG: thiol reductase thioredoxin [Spirochaetales bacterium]|jgi:hypothetical protein|nr:thiol reductase thioredoxin [Spirochaetales bacterium]